MVAALLAASAVYTGPTDAGVLHHHHDDGDAAGGSAPTPDGKPAPATPSDSKSADDKAPLIDLTKGPFIAQLEAGHMPPKAFEPDPHDLQPYLTASLGPAVAYTLAGRDQPLVWAPHIEAECTAIIHDLLRHWKGPAPDVQVRVVASPNFGAHANEAGVILVNLGTFGGKDGIQVADRDELAMLLGHELSHILLLHPRETGSLAVLTKLMKYGSGIYADYALYKDAQYSNNNLTLKPDEGMLLRSLATDAGSSSLMLDVLVPGRNRHREIEADELGLDLAWRSGFRVYPETVAAFVDHNAADDHDISQRMEQMRGVMIAMLARVIAKQAKAHSSGLGAFGVAAEAFGALEANSLATQIFDRLSNARKQHLDPEMRKKLLIDYYNANVANQEWDRTTETNFAPSCKKNPKLHCHPLTRGTPFELAKLESARLEAAVEWNRAYDAMSIAAAGTVLEDEQQRIRDSKHQDTIMDQLRNAMSHGDTDVGKDVKAGTAGATTAGGAAPAMSEKDKAVLDQAHALAARMNEAGVINPLVSSASTGAGKLAWLVLQQDPRARVFWGDGQIHGYPVTGLYRAYGASLVRAGNAARLPGLIDDYKAKVGTNDPILDIAVAAAVAQNQTVQAEKLAAHCLEVSPHGLYPVCAGYLGYNPAAKGGKAKTPEGQAAFAAASTSVSLKALLNLGGNDD